MWPLPIEELFMAGKSSVDTLHKLGIFTIGQLAQSPVNILETHLKSHGRTLWEYANGIDDSVVNPIIEDLKGVGNSVTLPNDLDNIEEIEKVLLMLSEKVAGRLRAGKQLAKTVAVEIKYNDFTKTSKQTTFEGQTDSGTEIYQLSKELFSRVWSGKPVRLLGVRTSNLMAKGAPAQMSIMELFNENRTDVGKKFGNALSREKLRKLDAALDEIKDKYGKDAISRASLLKNKKTED